MAPWRFAVTGRPAAGWTTNEEPIAMNRSQASASASARRISASGIACPNEMVAVLTMPPQAAHSGRVTSRSKAARMGASS